jgi:hypothetical protein
MRRLVVEALPGSIIQLFDNYCNIFFRYIQKISSLWKASTQKPVRIFLRSPPLILRPHRSPYGHRSHHEHPEGEDVEAWDRLHDQAGQQDPLPAQNHEQQYCRHQICRPLHRWRKGQKEGESIGQRSNGEGQSQPSQGEAWTLH